MEQFSTQAQENLKVAMEKLQQAQQELSYTQNAVRGRVREDAGETRFGRMRARRAMTWTSKGCSGTLTFGDGETHGNFTLYVRGERHGVRTGRGLLAAGLYHNLTVLGHRVRIVRCMDYKTNPPRLFLPATVIEHPTARWGPERACRHP